MKNFDKFMEKMKSQSRTVGSWGCEDFIRDVYEDEKMECPSYDCYVCLAKAMKYLNEEYKEPIQLTHDEYVALKNLGSEFKFIARDKEENCLSAYTSKPYKGNVDLWLTGGVWCELLEHLFPFIKWEDEEPYEIAKLIEDYEKENLL